MGVNLESSNLVLPTTRLLLEIKRARGQRPDIATNRRDLYQSHTRPKGFVKQFMTSLKAAFRLVNLIAEEWFRQIVIWSYTLRGYYVLFDRHFYFDYYDHDIANQDPDRPFSSRLHGFMLQKLYPKPDFVIFLDAPTEVLFARKSEGTLAALEDRRQEYVRLRDVVKNCAVVDVSQPVDDVTREVSELIMNFYHKKIGMKT
jgi:thymidylate kinase